MQRRRFPDALRHEAEEIADAHRWLDDTATGEAQPVERLPHSGDDLRAGVVGVSGRGDRRLILLRGEDIFQLGRLFSPAAVAGAVRALKRFRDATPANVFGELGLFVGRCLPVGGLQLFQQADGGDVIAVLGLFPTLTNGSRVDGEEAGRFFLRGYACGWSVSLSSSSGIPITSFSAAPLLYGSASC